MHDERDFGREANDDEQKRHRLADIAEGVILEWVDTAYRIALAGLGTDDTAARQAVDQMRHLHLAEPWIPANRIATSVVGLDTKGEQ